ncbi:hypothetical protein AX15_004318 [Amanita polypyramis BW_CC]|nr:hypothetical protein AX15_004318 [Amanita polypyramis BW_CC]
METVVKELALPPDVGAIQLDVTNVEDIERVVKTARVVINAVGPYHRYATPVVRACVRNSVHYVDLSGETPWIKDIIMELDYYATKTGAIVVPSCGMDSIPSDLSAYLSNKNLKSVLAEMGRDDSLATSTTAFKIKTHVSGGTLHSLITTVEDFDPHRLLQSMRPYSLSPATGPAIPFFKPLYKLTVPGEKPLFGAYFVMRGTNSAIVQRTFGLLEAQALKENLRRPSPIQGTATIAQKQRYGLLFKYDEFHVMQSVWQALLFSCSIALAIFLLFSIPPIRWLAKKYLPQPGEGPSDEDMKNGYLVATNLTTSASHPHIQVKTVIKVKGDPGYLVTSAMISECALSLLLPPVSANSAETSAIYSAIPTLPPLAQKGGVLTPMTAFGDVLLERLRDTGLFQFSSSIVSEKQKAT